MQTPFSTSSSSSSSSSSSALAAQATPTSSSSIPRPVASETDDEDDLMIDAAPTSSSSPSSSSAAAAAAAASSAGVSPGPNTIRLPTRKALQAAFGERDESGDDDESDDDDDESDESDEDDEEPPSSSDDEVDEVAAGSSSDEDDDDDLSSAPSRSVTPSTAKAENLFDTSKPPQAAQPLKVGKILAWRVAEGQPGPEFFVTYKHRSYHHARWVTRAAITSESSYARGKLSAFLRKNPFPIPDGDEESIVNPMFYEVDRILARRWRRGVEEYLVKWCAQPYSSATWEELSVFKDADKVAEFNERSKLPTRPATRGARPPPSQWREMTESPEFKNGGTLHPWQLKGVSWLLFNWYQRRGCILADEMGLGKTVQSVVTTMHIHDAYSRGPFLVVAPLSTVQHWKREFEAWSHLNTVVYQGSKLDREMIRLYEFYYWNENGDEVLRDEHTKFNVLITTYESVMLDSAVLSRFKWRALIVDEAHRLKNQDSRLFKTLRTFDIEYSVLLTGTPIQNNLVELWTLLHFAEPDAFSSLSHFQKEFGNLQDSSQVARLHQVLAPYLLRRMKEDVAKNIPPKVETVVEVELTMLQKKYYRAVLERNRDFLYKGCHKSNVPHLINVVMQLRKVCNHPFLIRGVEDKELRDVKTREDVIRTYIHTSGKLVLLDKLLPKLQAGGHRVLIFSQLKIMLDILAHYMSLRGYKYERIDGDIRGNDRQQAIDRFTKPGSDRFVFLLSTRAGGLGINLASADTVIVYDSDWNPQNDIQAQARAHRIGQTKSVKVYRLITSRTYEQEMFRRASIKLGLDRAVLKKMQEKSTDMTFGESLAPLSQMDKNEINSLLKHGVYNLFNESADAASKSFCEEDIDSIMATRATTITTGGSGAKIEPSTFSKATFAVSSVNGESKVALDDPDFWQKMIPDLGSVKNLEKRFESGDSTASDEKRAEFLKQLGERVHALIHSRQSGVEPPHVERLMSLLHRVSSDEARFTKPERDGCVDWVRQIRKPRRVRKSVDRFGDHASLEELGEAIAELEPPLDNKKKKKKKRFKIASQKYRNAPMHKMGGPCFSRAARKLVTNAVVTVATSFRFDRHHPKHYVYARSHKPSHLSQPGNPYRIPDIGHWRRIRKMAELEHRPLREVAAYGLAFLQLCIENCSEDTDRDAFFAARELLFNSLPSDLESYDKLDFEESLAALQKQYDEEAAAFEAERAEEERQVQEAKKAAARAKALERANAPPNPDGKAAVAASPAAPDASSSSSAAASSTAAATAAADNNGDGDDPLVLKRRRFRFKGKHRMEQLSLKNPMDPKLAQSSWFPTLEDDSFLGEKKQRLEKKIRRWGRLLNAGKCIRRELDRIKDPWKEMMFRSSKSRAPASWWTAKEDLHFLVGVAIHGTELERIRDDPDLCFLEMVGPSTQPEDSSVKQENGESASSSSSSSSSAAAATDKPKLSWPLARSLEAYLHYLATSIDRVRRIAAREEERRAKIVQREKEKLQRQTRLQNVWNKRERHDLARWLCVLGARNWDLLRKLANLTRKDTDAIKQHWAELKVHVDYMVEKERRKNIMAMVADLKRQDEARREEEEDALRRAKEEELRRAQEEMQAAMAREQELQSEAQAGAHAAAAAVAATSKLSTVVGSSSSSSSRKRPAEDGSSVEPAPERVMRKRRKRKDGDDDEEDDDGDDLMFMDPADEGTYRTEPMKNPFLPPLAASLPQAQLTKCLNMVRRMMKSKRAADMVDLVDPVKSGYVDYFDVIERPMALRVVRLNLKNHAYPTVKAFADDVRLVWANARKYFAQDAELLKNLDLLSRRFEEALVKDMDEEDFHAQPVPHANLAMTLKKRKRTEGGEDVEDDGEEDDDGDGGEEEEEDNGPSVYMADLGELDPEKWPPLDKPENLGAKGSPSANLSQKMAERIHSRVRLMEGLEEALRLIESSAEKHALLGSAKLVSLKGMPDWWSPMTHDVALIRSVLSHGVGQIPEALEDPSLAPMWRATREGAEELRWESKEVWLKQFLRDRNPVVFRLMHLVDLIKNGTPHDPEVLGRQKRREREALVYTLAAKGELHPSFRRKGRATRSRSRRSSKRRKRDSTRRRNLTIHEVPRDEDGRVKLPLQVRGAVTIHSLGRVCLRKGFHRANAIWPVDYVSTRTHHSYKNPGERVQYTNRIMDGGDSPLFVVTAADDLENPITSHTASGAWCTVLQLVNESRPAGEKRSKVTVSGPEMFGFADPLVKMLIEELPDANECRNYRPIKPKFLAQFEAQRQAMKQAELEAQRKHLAKLAAKLKSAKAEAAAAAAAAGGAAGGGSSSSSAASGAPSVDHEGDVHMS